MSNLNESKRFFKFFPFLSKFGHLHVSRFQRCAANAWPGALQFVSWASEEKEAVVEGMYRKFCSQEAAKSDSAIVEEPLAEDEMEAYAEADLGEEEVEGDEAHKLLSSLQRETIFVDPEVEAEAAAPVTFKILVRH